MKFPKSIHAEGWLDHIEAGAPGRGPTDSPRTTVARADYRTRANDRLDDRLDDGPGGTGPQPLPTVTPPSGPAISPWLVGAGAGVALVVLAVSMSHNLTSAPAPAPASAGLVAQAGPVPVPAAVSPEDAQLAHAPTAAGPLGAEGVAAPTAQSDTRAAPVPVESPAAPALAAAPRATPHEPPTVHRDAALADVTARSAPPAMPLESAQPLPPLADATAAPASASAAAPAEPEDGGITVKVRAALQTDAVLAGVAIAVSTEHGVVTLEGQAPDAQARERATVVAAATTGVKGVDNRLTLPPVAVLGEGAARSGA